ncbi:MAG TPA: sensor domain-containing phosphodiesterase [Acidimicrobiales bacterium]
MANLSDSDQMKTGGEVRQAVETLQSLVFGMDIVAMVSNEDEMLTELSHDPMIASGAEEAFEVIRDLVTNQLDGGTEIKSFSCVVSGVEWGVLVEPIADQEWTVPGILFVARHGVSWTDQERMLIATIASLIGQVETLARRESTLLHQQRLDDLVGQVANRLMSASSLTRREVLRWTTQVLAEFLGADVAFLRSNDLERGLSVLEAEWPTRENVPDPDPLGAVPFDSDPIFEITKDLREPYYLGGPESPDKYQERVEKATGVRLVNGAGVPLLQGETTWGVLAFLHFHLHKWVPEEMNALRAIASMLMQLQARIDAEVQTEYNAHHDDLTGLPNRRALIRELKLRLDQRRDTAVLVVDLDRFKVMNDFLGHASGDKLLVTLADGIRRSLAPNEFAARLGGDEFVFLIDDVRSEAQVLESAEKILGLISMPVEIGGQRISHTASVGIALTGSEIVNGLDLLGYADVAMYAAKAQGRNQAVVFDEELREVVNERFRMELTLQKGIENGELRLHFQPEVDLNTGKILAVEALVRWQHPTRGLLVASDFIRVAEETGLVVEIGRWVFAESCRQLSRWQREYAAMPLKLRVNMSPAEFMTGDLVEYVEYCMKTNDIKGERLCIEITEHVVLHEPKKTARILEGFQKLGIEVAIDDFGTGFASMTELKNLPVNLLKLDMSFVRGITTDLYDCAIVESIIRLGHALNLVVVAEGIESSSIVDKLLELGCHRGQGYFIARPMSADDLAPLLDSGLVSLSSIRSELPSESDEADTA